MNFTQRIGACAVAAVMAAAGWADQAFAAGPSPSSPSTVIAPQVLRDQSQRPADAIERATDPVRSAPSGDKEQAPGARAPQPKDPASAGPKLVPPGPK